MRKLTILTMALALAAVAGPAMAETGCPGSEAETLFAVGAPVLATPAEAAPAVDGAAGEGQEPLLLSSPCERRCQREYEECLVICSKNPCLISCEDQRCYCLQGCGSGCGVIES